VSLTLEQKKTVVAEVNAVAGTAQAAIAAEYAGLTVAQMTDLRVRARKAGVFVKVVKNTLARRALEGTTFECLQPKLTGPLLLVFSQEDPGAGARVVRDFVKDNQKLVPVAIAFAGAPRAGRPPGIGHSANAGRGPVAAARRTEGAWWQARTYPGRTGRSVRACARCMARQATSRLNPVPGFINYLFEGVPPWPCPKKN